MWVLYLSSSNRILERRRISVGGLASLTTDCRLIIRHGLNLVAASIIVVHNHPSGVAKPSGEDEVFTSRLKEAAALFDIALLDHVIVAGGGSYSFRADGKL
jgi:DNA repair protein RadC